MVFSIPFVVTTHIEFWNYQNKSVICRNMIYDEHGDIPFFTFIMANRYIVCSTRLFFLFFEFIIPTLVIIYFTGKILIRLFDLYMGSTQRVEFNSGARLLIFILLSFIVKNTALIMVTGIWHEIFYDNPACPTSVSSGETWFLLYEVYRITTTLNSFLYFWTSSEFRKNVQDCNIQLCYMFLNVVQQCWKILKLFNYWLLLCKLI